MEATFTLVVWTSWVLWTTDEIRLPGFDETECKLLAAEVKQPKKARCEPEKLQGALPEGFKRYHICSFGGTCWTAVNKQIR